MGIIEGIIETKIYIVETKCTRTHNTESSFLKYTVHKVEVTLVYWFGNPYV